MVKVSNNIANQFEVPILFYVLCLVAYSLNVAGTLAVTLAWLFAISRYAHAYVHINSNYVPIRLRLFLVGCLVLLTMLVFLVWQLAVNISVT